ncbi:uncharacterized protein B0P05DRAFT_20511 [Gilbertella persicaria]|uniref:uncharacterized protein n=1 Tax=Gilbertella persicaria TaxID=101096 RepID=UPI00221F3B44|nr:uncharacterized protein B0P05DRAFT_20511 [Gilbertella persicaria]KAI8046997.1 hypothetical protein B0P05DRAFT_20511 [Gilbertella persicaria]
MHEFKVSSLQITSTVYYASRNDFLDDLIHDVSKEEDEEENEVQQEEAQQEENEVQQDETQQKGNEVQQEEEEEEEESQKGNEIHKKLLNKVEHDELEKLAKSSCINLLNENHRSYTSLSLSEEYFNDIKSECFSRQSHFDNYLTSIMYETINNLFDELKQFQFDSDAADIIAYLDSEKNKETNKENEKYILLSIVSSIINNFNLWKKEEKLSENTYLRKFAEIIDILFKKTNLFIKDGENVCEASKRMQIMNDGDVTYGRRLDMIVASEQDDRDIELCSLEFKKGDAPYATLLYQQSKNLRINACILNEIHLLTFDESISIAYLDFAGRNAYISQIFRMDDKYIAHEVGKVAFIKNLLELDTLRKTMFNLFRWKRSLVSNSNIVSLANLNQCNKFALADISNAFIQSSRFSTTHNVKPAQIFMSPSNTGKRTRGVFEQDN